MNAGQLRKILEKVPDTTEVVVADFACSQTLYKKAYAMATSALISGPTYRPDEGERGDEHEEHRRRVVVIR